MVVTGWNKKESIESSGGDLTRFGRNGGGLNSDLDFMRH